MTTGAQSLVGPAEIGRMLGVSRQRVQQLAARDDWPEPFATLARGRVWERAAIEAWARDHGRVIRDLGAVAG